MKMKFKGKAHSRTMIVIVTIMIIGIVLLVGGILQSIFNGDSDLIASAIISSVESILVLASLVMAIVQLKDSKEIARASFITELNKSFVENENYTAVYNKLQLCRDNNCGCENGCNARLDTEVTCNLNITKGEISNYLTFFETIYILYKRRVVSLEILDDLFAYRFFLAVHSKIFQQQKLMNQPYNFRNIYCLEYVWLEYRKSKNLLLSEESVYNCLRLEDLVGPEVYMDLTKEVR